MRHGGIAITLPCPQEHCAANQSSIDLEQPTLTKRSHYYSIKYLVVFIFAISQVFFIKFLLLRLMVHPPLQVFSNPLTQLFLFNGQQSVKKTTDQVNLDMYKASRFRIHLKTETMLDADIFN